VNTKDAINSRRAIKEFDREHVLTDKEEKELLSLAMLSPTAFNIQLHLPDDHVIAMFVAIGKGTKAAWPRSGRLGVEEVVIRDSFKKTGDTSCQFC